MARFAYHPSVVRFMRGCRYAVYVSLLVLIVVDALESRGRLSDWVVALIALPAVWHLTLQWSRRAVCAAHAIEACLLPLLLFGLDAPMSVQLSTWLLILICNAALWRFRSIPVVVLMLTGITLTLIQIDGLSIAGIRLIDFMPLCLMVGVVLAVGQLFNWQSQRLRMKHRAAADRAGRLARYVPAEVDTGSDRRRRQWSTVAFVDLSEFTTVANRLPPDVMQDVVDDFLRTVGGALEEAGGTINKFLGDGVLCLFTPPDRENRDRSALKCVRALLALPRLMDGLNERWRAEGYAVCFEVSMGVASGHCTVGNWGWDERLDFTVIGPPVNLASRLQAAADRGTLLIDQATASLIDAFLDVGEARDLDLKGLPAAVAYMPRQV